MSIMLEAGLLLVIVAVVGFAYLIGYCQGRLTEARSRMKPMAVKRLNKEAGFEQQRW